ncbi:MAG: DUF3822 family protein [Prevotella sp.]|nr:DUF3822 family protein [Prevotella sp.]
MTDKNNIIAIRIGNQSLAFAAKDDTSANGLAYEPYMFNSSISVAANLREAFKKSTLLMRDYQRAAVFVDSQVLLEPVEEFNNDDKSVLYEYTFRKKQQQTILHSIVPDLSVAAVFSVDSDIMTVLNDHFRDVRVMPLTMPVWSAMNSRNYSNTYRKLYAHFHDSKMELFAFSNNHFIFYNSFDIVGNNDAAYYTVSVWKQLGFDQERDELHIVWQVDNAEDVCESIRIYLRNVFLVHPRADFNRHRYTEVSGLPYDLMAYFINN